MVPALAKRFVQEARVGAGIESDRAVEVLAAGIDEGLGLPWLVSAVDSRYSRDRVLSDVNFRDLVQFGTILTTTSEARRFR